MIILTALETIDMNPDMTKEPTARNTAAVNLANFIKQNSNHNMQCTTTKVIFGVLNPDEIIKTAGTWNYKLAENFINALARVWPKDKPLNLNKPVSFELDTLDTYELKKAAMALDNDYNPFGKYAILHPGEFSFSPTEIKVVMTEEMLEDITSHPENYALFTSNTHEAKSHNTTPAYNWPKA